MDPETLLKTRGVVPVDPPGPALGFGSGQRKGLIGSAVGRAWHVGAEGSAGPRPEIGGFCRERGPRDHPSGFWWTSGGRPVGSWSVELRWARAWCLVDGRAVDPDQGTARVMCQGWSHGTHGTADTTVAQTVASVQDGRGSRGPCGRVVRGRGWGALKSWVHRVVLGEPGSSGVEHGSAKTMGNPPGSKSQLRPTGPRGPSRGARFKGRGGHGRGCAHACARACGRARARARSPHPVPVPRTRCTGPVYRTLHFPCHVELARDLRRSGACTCARAARDAGVPLG